MADSVTDVIAARSHQPDRLTTMVVWSVAAHVGVVALLVVMPMPRIEEPPRTVMTISLGGAIGPRTEGTTQIGGQAVQAPPPEPLPSRAAPTPPAPVQPRMTLPPPRPQPPPRQPPATRPAPQQAPRTTNRAAVTGEQPRTGSTPVDTGARGQGFGLSSGGGGGGMQLDVSDFCCPEYLEEMITVIHRHWAKNHGVSASTVMRFTIRRDGTIDTIRPVRSSGHWALDNAAERALHLARQLPPLPAQFTNPSLTVQLTFEYER